tara:strand:- start:1340 stop:1642 length:303 start_codon:yes stop_codon:yes gene_type:complete
MWDIVVEMATDRLWIYTGIVGSIFGAITVAYLSTTRLGVWFYRKVDQFLDYLVKRWGLKWLEEPEDLWRKRYPQVSEKMDELEMRLDEIDDRLSDLENES